MTNLKTIGGTAAFITLMGSTAAFADVTAKEVWADWRNYMTGFGYEISFDEAMSGDTLNISNMAMSMNMPDDGGAVKAGFGTIGFQERGDGTVAIIMPENMPVSISVDDEFSVVMNYAQSGMSMIVSGSVNDMSYDYAASSVSMDITELVVEGDKIDTAKLGMTMTNVVSKTTSNAGDLRKMTQTFAIDMLTYDVDITEPDGEDFAFALKGSIAELKGSSDTVVPKDINFEQFAAALNAGFSGKGAFSWGAGGYEFSVKDRNANTNGTSSSDSGELHFAMDRESIGYGGSTNGTKASFKTSEFPLPIDIAIGETLFNLLMPVNKTDTPSDFGLTIKLGDFSVSDGIWGMIDPGAVLSRDPATIHMDFAGKANWLVDIMNPESDEVMNADVPGQLHALTLKSLQVKAAGAELTGAGAFTFNNDDLETFGGLPAPTGAIDLMLTGGNGLMDNLVAMGLLPEEQAMGARMMMGLFAIVGEGADTLISKIEVTADGQVLANGQRLQ